MPQMPVTNLREAMKEGEQKPGPACSESSKCRAAGPLARRLAHPSPVLAECGDKAPPPAGNCALVLLGQAAVRRGVRESIALLSTLRFQSIKDVEIVQHRIRGGYR